MTIRHLLPAPFPARAGMNRYHVISFALVISVPRARGDEPIAGFLHMTKDSRSPRARG